MIIKIRLFTILREIAGKREDRLNFIQSTVTIADVLKALSQKYKKPFDDYVFDTEGQVKGFLQFLINGASTSTLQGQDSPLRDGDVLAILPPVGGG
jgi:molybdopterin synthase sulfur carrier subunit